jgi:hypothetical protein
MPITLDDKPAGIHCHEAASELIIYSCRGELEQDWRQEGRPYSDITVARFSLSTHPKLRPDRWGWTIDTKP